MDRDEAKLRELLAEQPSVVAALRKSYGLRNEQEVDAVVGRFARARKGAPEKAFRLMSEDVAWRCERDAIGLRRLSQKAVLGCDPAVLSQFYERRLVGLDRQGRPCYYLNYAGFDVRELLRVFSTETLERYHIWEQERAIVLLDELRRRRRGGPSTMSVVMDIKGLSLRQYANADVLRFVRLVAKIDQKHYPERMGQLVVVNASRAFGVLWAAIEPFLEPSTRSKITITSKSATDLGIYVEGNFDDGTVSVSRLASRLLASPRRDAQLAGQYAALACVVAASHFGLTRRVPVVALLGATLALAALHQDLLGANVACVCVAVALLGVRGQLRHLSLAACAGALGFCLAREQAGAKPPAKTDDVSSSPWTKTMWGRPTPSVRDEPAAPVKPQRRLRLGWLVVATVLAFAVEVANPGTCRETLGSFGRGGGAHAGLWPTASRRGENYPGPRRVIPQDHKKEKKM